MTASTHTLTLPGAMLERGLWLYVWRVETCDGFEVLYVGRTGDSSSHKAAPPYWRMGQHLGHSKGSNMLRQNLNRRDIDPESCRGFELIAHGTLFDQQIDMESHSQFATRWQL